MKHIPVTIVLCLLSACASAPVNFGQPDPSSRIGLVHLIDESPKHVHVGTTVIQNFETPNATGTDFGRQFEEKCTDLLSGRNYRVKTIQPTQALDKARTDLFSYVSSSIHFEDQVKVELDKLAAENSVDFLILVYPVSGPAWVNSPVHIDGYGLYTRCGFGKCSAQALSYVSTRIYDVVNRSSLKAANFRFFQNPPMPESFAFSDPKAIEPHAIDNAAALALESFNVLIEDMLRTSQFID